MGETDIGKRLIGLRTIKGVSQDTVAEACNISRVALSRYENGSRMPRIEISSRLAEYYGVSVDYLLGLDDSPSSHAPTIDTHTYYAEKFGPETQKVVDELLARLQAMPEDRREDAAKGALTFVRGVVSAENQEGNA